jgi:hypothetical protein
MVRSGRIDNDAYAGEPLHDDAESELRDTDEESAEDMDDDTLPLDEIAELQGDPLADIIQSGHGTDADADDYDTGADEGEAD